MNKKISFGMLLKNKQFNKIRFSRKGEVIATNEKEKIAMQISDYMKKQMCNEERLIGSVSTDMKKYYVETLNKIADIYNNREMNTFLKKACLLDLKDDIIIKYL